MPVTKSAKKALRTSTRRHGENIVTREGYKKAVKSVRKAVVAGATDVMDSLITSAQSVLDRAAKNNTIHANKAARLKSRLAKQAAKAVSGEAAHKDAKKKAVAKKATVKKATAKKSAK